MFVVQCVVCRVLCVVCCELDWVECYFAGMACALEPLGFFFFLVNSYLEFFFLSMSLHVEFLLLSLLHKIMWQAKQAIVCAQQFIRGFTPTIKRRHYILINNLIQLLMQKFRTNSCLKVLLHSLRNNNVPNRFISQSDSLFSLLNLQWECLNSLDKQTTTFHFVDL